LSVEFKRPTRGDGPPRHGPEVRQIPDVGPSTLDASVYTDPGRYELERTLVLRNSWLIAGRSSELPEPGDWIVYEGHGETVVVCRQADGSVAAFHNVCQHRGARITAESGCGAKRFTCPWHGWVYGTDGDLLGVPDRGDFDASQLEGLRAPAVAAEEWGGWVWIFLAGPGAAPSLESWLGEVGPELAAYRMEDMVLVEKLVYDVPVNYKAIVDGFNEMYHIAELHKVPGPDVKAGRETSYQLLRQNSMMVVPLSRTLEPLAETGDHQAHAICHYVVFPLAVFNNNPEHLQLFHPVPIGPTQTRFVVWQLVYEGNQEYESLVDVLWSFLKPIVEQDIFVFNELAATKQSMAYTHNRFNERECKPTGYHAAMEAMVRGASAFDIVANDPIELLDGTGLLQLTRRKTR
jgi:phenylpropionate dioxygenase-like ring-hydroxylating dioxygenase large terminal subunit